jgi:hypothetical protein
MMMEGAEAETAAAEAAEVDEGLKLPSAYAILFVLIAVVAAATWVVPSGAFSRVLSETLGKEVAVPGTYHLVASAPQGMVVRPHPHLSPETSVPSLSLSPSASCLCLPGETTLRRLTQPQRTAQDTYSDAKKWRIVR